LLTVERVGNAIVDFITKLRQRFPKVKKVSTVLGWKIDIVTKLAEKMPGLSTFPRLKRLQKTIELLLLREPVKKAPLLTPSQLRKLLTTTNPKMAVVVALMSSSGSRFADAAMMRPSDFVRWNSQTGMADLRIMQQKNIRKRLKQRWVSQQIPLELTKYLNKRLLAARQMNAPLVEVSYWDFLTWLKKFLGDEMVSTYSIRRTVFEMIRRRVSSIEEMMRVTLHFNAESLRWYLEAPLEDDRKIQMHATSWHIDFLGQK